MKLRIKGNFIRLRLGQSEVLRLALEGSVEESTAFGPFKQQCLAYVLSVSPEEIPTDASFTDRRIEISVPRSAVEQWAATDQVSIEAVQRTGFGGELRILIEKDFACIDGALAESQADAFPHPHLGTDCPPTNRIERLA